MAIAAIAIYVFVKSEATPVKKDDEEHLINQDKATKPEETWVDLLTTSQKRILGIVLSIVSGIFYGVNFDPPTYRMDHGGSTNGLDYVFSHFCGIYITSTVYFVLYCIAKKNKPVIYPEAVLPGLLCGALWAAAQICWFVANASLALVVAFPIVSTGPGVVASLWGIFVFKEITGRRNIYVLLCAFACTFTAVTMITLSKVLKHN
jgi:drug/metabolite transporter (DMT)-like permease